jgi:hypothetical protein
VPNGFVFDAWHTLVTSSDGSTLVFQLDGVVVDTMPVVAGDGYDLQTVSIEAYNFGQTDANGLNSYSVNWDNVDASAVVPEPANCALIAGFASLGMLWARQRAKRKLILSL